MMTVIYVLLAFGAGGAAAWALQHYRAVVAGEEAVRQTGALLEKAQREATSKSQEILLKAKEEADALRRDAVREAEARGRDLATIEDRLNQREELIEDRQKDL